MILKAQEEHLSVTDYINRINSTTPSSNTPQLRNHRNENLARNETSSHTPIIATPNQAPITVNPILLRNRLLSESRLPNLLNPPRPPVSNPTPPVSNPTPPVSNPTPSVSNPATIATTVAASQEETPRELSSAVTSSAVLLTSQTAEELPPRRIPTRSSMKRNTEDAKNIRAHLLTSIAESKPASAIPEVTARKRIGRPRNNNNTTDASMVSTLSSDESTHNISTSDANESLLPPARTTLKRRCSARIVSNTSISEPSGSSAKSESGLVRRQSIRFKRSKP